MKNKEQIEILARLTGWLEQIERDRGWLAERIGVDKSTVDGWFAPRGKRNIPTPIMNLIEIMMKQNELGEPKFTFQEGEKIRQAMSAAEYISFPEFAHDAVVTMAEKILSGEIS